MESHSQYSDAGDGRQRLVQQRHTAWWRMVGVEGQSGPSRLRVLTLRITACQKERSEGLFSHQCRNGAKGAALTGFGEALRCGTLPCREEEEK